MAELLQRQCEQCGAAYMPIRVNQKVCSKECRRKADIKRANAWIEADRDRHSAYCKTSRKNAAKRETEEQRAVRLAEARKRMADRWEKMTEEQKIIYRQKVCQRQKANREKKNAYDRKYRQERKASDPAFRFEINYRARIKQAFKKGGVGSVETQGLLGCTVEQAMQHIAAQFQPGMTWDNWGIHTWHIDHIVPCASFDLDVAEEREKCFHYTNLQPLWAEENLRKSASLVA